MTITIFNYIKKDKVEKIFNAISKKEGIVLYLTDETGEILMTSSASEALGDIQKLLFDLAKEHTDQNDQIQAASKDLYVRHSFLIANGENIGSLFACAPEKHILASQENVLELISEYIKDTIFYNNDIQSLSSEVVHSYNDITLLYGLSSKLSISLNLDEISKTIVEHIQIEIPVQNISILLFDKEKEELYSQYSTNHKGKNNPAFRLKINEGITGHVVSEKAGVIECDVKRDKNFKEVSYPITSLLSVPMIARGKLVGAINLSDKLNKKEFSSNDFKLANSIAATAANAFSNSILYTDIRELFWSLVKALVSAIDAKDRYTCGHSKRVADMSVIIAKECEVSEKELDRVYLAALLHDIGKIGVSESILLKTEKLNESEWIEIQKHPYHAANILDSVKQFEKISLWVKHEHERFDGFGYPDKLKGEDIPLASRIIAVADAYDAMTSDRAYRKGLPIDNALSLLKKSSGEQFDPEIYKAFLLAYKRGEFEKIES